MLAVAVLSVVAAYFAVLFFLTRWAYRYARREGKSKRKAGFIAAIVFSIIFLPVFWDTIPSRVSYYNHCSTEAGVTQYKTLEQWRAENPGVYENLYHYSDSEKWTQRSEAERIFRNGIQTSVRMVRTPRFITYTYTEKLPFSVKKFVTEFTDIETGEIIANWISFYAGPGNVLETGGEGYKIWLNQPMCGNDKINQFYQIADTFENIYE